jgi:hypothetical protein
MANFPAFNSLKFYTDVVYVAIKFCIIFRKFDHLGYKIISAGTNSIKPACQSVLKSSTLHVISPTHPPADCGQTRHFTHLFCGQARHFTHRALWTGTSFHPPTDFQNPYWTKLSSQHLTP